MCCKSTERIKIYIFSVPRGGHSKSTVNLFSQQFLYSTCNSLALLKYCSSLLVSHVLSKPGSGIFYDIWGKSGKEPVISSPGGDKNNVQKSSGRKVLFCVLTLCPETELPSKGYSQLNTEYQVPLLTIDISNKTRVLLFSSLI